MKKIGTQSIETKRLLLRPFLESDAQAMYDNWASRSDNLLHVTWDAHESPEVTQQSIARWVENYQNMDFYKWAICLKEKPEQVIGDISVVDRVVTANPASGRVMAKAGMSYEGTFRQAVLHKGQVKDFSVYGILSSDIEKG